MKTILIILLSIISFFLFLYSIKQSTEIDDLKEEKRRQKVINKNLMDNIDYLCEQNAKK